MAIGRISGALLFSDLDRQSVDLAFTTNGKPLTYMDFTNFRFGVNTNSVVDTFTVAGTANVSGVSKVFGNLIAASGTASSDVSTGALVVIGGAGISGNLHAGNLFADNFSGNISNANGSSIFGNIGVTYAGSFGSLNTANAVISGGYIASLTNAYITTSRIENFSTANAVISGGYIETLTNVTIATANFSTLYSATVNATNANVTNSFASTLVATNFSTGNVVVNGGYITNLTNVTATTGNVITWYAATVNATNANLATAVVTNFSTANAVITGGYVNNLANLTATTAQLTNVSSGNVVISGGYISSLSNASIVTANIGNVKIEDVTVSSRTGNLILSPIATDGNALIIFETTSAIQLPFGSNVQRPTSVYAGAVRWNTTSSIIEYYNGSGWVSLTGQINSQTIVPDGASTVYTLDYSTTAEGIIVSINGTLQQPGVAYTVAGNQITFAEIPLITDVVSIRYIAAGTVTAENTQEVNSGNIALTLGAVLIDSFDKNTYRSAKYLASTTAATSAEFAEFAVTQFDTSVSVSNVNRAITGSTLANITANISGSTVRVYATSSATAQMRLQKTYIVV
jgi:mucin-19